jgi:AcrR family transcriptional regulator
MAGLTDGTGRVAQRRRTRKAIVDAASALLAAGADPSIGDIADAADVSRRTIYTHFPTLDQLLLDAAAGALSIDVDGALTAAGGADVHDRIRALISALADGIAETLPIGRKMIRLTVDAPPEAGEPKRGYRRVGWIEQALEPIRPRLGRRRYDDLVSALTCVIGWEAFIVLTDVRGLNPDQARAIVTTSALALIDVALADAASSQSLR